MVFKWFLPLSIHYTHFGSLKDFPIRLIITPSSHFQAGGVDVDVVLNQSDMITNNDNYTNNSNIGRTNNFFFLKTYLVLKFDPQNPAPTNTNTTQHQDFYLLSRKASLTVNVACRMDNSYGRGCWRDGGTCFVSLLELLNNADLSTTKNILFSSRKIYNSGYNVAEDDKLTGVVSLATYGDYPNLTKETLTSYSNNSNNGGSITEDRRSNKWHLIALGSNLSTNSSILSGLFLKTKTTKVTQQQQQQQQQHNETANPTTTTMLSMSDLIRLLFGLVIVNEPRNTPYEFSKNIESYFKRNTVISKTRSNDYHKSTIDKVEADWSRYKRMLDALFSNLVEIDIYCTKRMKCPWTPMDTAVFESYSDYSNDYINYEDGGGGKYDNTNVVTTHNTNLSEIYELLFEHTFSSPSSDERSGGGGDGGGGGGGGHYLQSTIKSKESNSSYIKHTTLSQQYEKATLNPEYINRNVWLFDETDMITHNEEKFIIGGRKIGEERLKKKCQGELHETVKIMSFIEKLCKNDDEKYKKRIYLPFFAYVIHQPLLVYKNYWGITLNILISRNSHLYSSYEDFETKFFNAEYTPPAERARLSFELICTYAQSLEYISDYYMTKKNDRNGNRKKKCENHGDNDDEEEEEDSQKIEIEQFWNSLRSMCGDCDDLSFAILQFYYNFVKNKTGASFQYIQANKVLREMRRMLQDNYVVLYNIEGVYLAKQTAGGETRLASMYDRLRPKDAETLSSTPYTKLPDYLKNIVDDYYSDVTDMNSAHAALKLIPKLYFERCVNRSYEVLNSKTNNNNNNNNNNSGEKGKRQLKGPFNHCFKGESTPSSCNSSGNFTCKYHLNLPDTYNDDLPVLMGEGTSMLNCGSNVPDTCVVSMFKDYVLSDELINDIAKVPIYAKKGESDFYKASLFGTCLDFMDTENVVTFTYCRENDHFYNQRRKERPHQQQQQQQNKQKLPFLRGVSHKQLSFKSEKVILLPYGHSLDNTSDNYTLKEITQHPCQHIHFANPEISPFMKSICLSECQKRLRPMKVKRQPMVGIIKNSNNNVSKTTSLLGITTTNRTSRQNQLLKMLNINNNISNPQVYNMLSCDTKWNVQTSFNLLKDWCNKMNTIHDNTKVTEHYGKYLKDTSISFSPGRGGFFSMFLDNYYITSNFLEHLERNIAYRCPLRFETSFLLEVHSADIILWKLRFDIKTIVV